ncbi:CYTH domain-containing protein [Desulfovibrio sp. OttesenSCG-928-C06]|nr:CYTH domain-containing protein [Desulfovibrio sp. OttesenSCG-928-C06]
MGKEIERKFLITDQSWRYDRDGHRITGETFCQGYLNDDKNRIVRLRLAGDRGFITIKGIANGITRSEFEYEIPARDCREMLDSLAIKPLIEKMRYKINFAGNIWEVDEFMGENEGLVIAELELETEDQKFEKPHWAGQEVTGDPRYFNSNLASAPYKFWA